MIAIEKGVIARWKIDTPFENWLGKRADNSCLFKKLYCLYYRVFDSKYYKKGIDMAKKTINTYNAREIIMSKEKDILYDMVYSLHRFGFTFNEYFLYELYKKNTLGREEFVSDKMRYDYYCKMNTDDGQKLLRDKGRTYDRLREYFKRNCVACYSENERDVFVDFVKHHDRFIYKPIGEDCGRGVKIYNSKENDAEKLFYELFKTGAFIAEELINQSQLMGKFHNSSINTVRILTITCKNGVVPVYSFFRIGRGGAIVDNAGAGGIFANVDIDSGIVISKAVSEYTNESFLKHPDTGQNILGFELPKWNEAIEFCKKMALSLPEMKHIGWDVAYTDDGWVLVEANGSSQPLSQMASKKGVKREFIKCMENI